MAGETESSHTHWRLDGGWAPISHGFARVRLALKLTSRVPVTSSRNAVIKRCVRHEAHGQAQSIEVLSTQGKRCVRILVVDDRVETMASRRPRGVPCDERPSLPPARSDCDPNAPCDGHRIRDASVTGALSRDIRDGEPRRIAGQPIGSPVCLCL